MRTTDELETETSIAFGSPKSGGAKIKAEPAYFVLIAVCTILILLGTFFRLKDIEKKPIWGDEATTLITTLAGDGDKNPSDAVYVSCGDLNKTLAINQRLDLSNFLSYVRSNRSPNGPLYFYCVRLWCERFGNTLEAARTLSVAFSLLALPLVFFVSMELFGCSMVAFLSTALLALSPLLLLYAQEARPYSLWIISILLGFLLLSRAFRTNTRLSWALYAVSQVFAFLTHPASLIITATHGLTILSVERAKLRPFCASMALAAIPCAIWIFGWPERVVQYKRTIFNTWSSEAIALQSWIAGTFHSLLRGFLDFNRPVEPAVAIGYLAVVILSVFSLWYMWRRASVFSGRMIVFSTIGLTVTVAAIDLASGGFKTTVPRYLIPSVLGLLIAVSFTLASGLKSSERKIRAIAVVIAIPLLASMLGSDYAFSSAGDWWNKSIGRERLLVENFDSKETLWVSSDIKGALVLASLLPVDQKFIIVNQAASGLRFPTQCKRVVYSGRNRALAELFATVYGFKVRSVPDTENFFVIEK